MYPKSDVVKSGDIRLTADDPDNADKIIICFCYLRHLRYLWLK
jgi:hypothetical protein